jgi:hypothetical protein
MSDNTFRYASGIFGPGRWASLYTSEPFPLDLSGEIEAEFALKFLNSFKNLLEHGLFYTG